MLEGLDTYYVYDTSSFFFVQDQKLKNVVMIGSQGSLEEKTITVCYGSDFVNVMFVNFCCAKKETAQPRRNHAAAPNAPCARTASVTSREKPDGIIRGRKCVSVGPEYIEWW
ncbi:1-phosphatidylinositol 4,5-bisphosphate phosphodiesterase classes I and II [Eumeta japonica]|uniref:1-phosphatidylinositol 4,5-bisphosphate phosphodiesterase classes I and II n=1 Tax=Eumeta variegata TaxID=151549 RepID=A0A4C1SBS3_EUMVA|nr:1-phosphatidylinositol 4,5-bisphosphate phosphodiesterase classes I and II [Eumeta japonica]